MCRYFCTHAAGVHAVAMPLIAALERFAAQPGTLAGWMSGYMTEPLLLYTFSGQFRRQCMHYGNGAGNFGVSAVRRPVGHDSAAAMSKLVALLPNYMQIVQNWSEKGVVKRDAITHECSHGEVNIGRCIHGLLFHPTKYICFHHLQP